MQHSMRIALLLLTAMVFAPMVLAAPAMPPAPSDMLLPIPASVQSLPGRYKPSARIAVALSDLSDAELRELGEEAADILRNAWHGKVTVSPTASDDTAALRLVLAAQPQANPESYTLQIDANGIERRRIV
jgi:hypothetical protein